MNTHDDMPEYEHFCRVVRDAVSNPDLRLRIINAGVDYATARVCNAIDDVCAKMEKSDD